MKVMPALIILLLACLLSSAQTLITGKVKDSKGRPLNGASISIKDSYDGATADSTGSFGFKTSETGQKILIITSIGYKMSEQSINITGTAMKIEAILREEPNELTAVVITAGSFEASDTKRTTVLNPIDIVTTASANADITSAIRTLPGAQQVGENGGLFVRGGTAEETKVFIDGGVVNNFFFSSVPDIAQRGRFSPFIFKGTVFSSGGYSALYGQALSSALILESIDLADQSSADFGLSTVGANAGYQRLSKKKNASWGVNYSYTNLAAYFAVVKQRIDNFKVPELHNGEVNFRIKTSKTGIVKFYTYFNTSNFGLRRPDIDSANLKNSFGLKNFNLYSNLSWKEKIGKKWKMNLGASFSTNTDKINNQLQNQSNENLYFNYEPYNSKSFSVVADGSLAQMKAVFERRLYGLSAIRFGGEYLFYHDRSDFSNQYISNAITTVDDHYKAGFAEADFYLTNDLAAKIGGRMEHSSLLDKANIVPRASLAYKVGNKAQVSFAYGIFYQKPEKDYFLRNFLYDDLLYTKAAHYIINYQKVTNERTFRIEGFYKKYNDLIKTFSSKGGAVADSLANGGFGYAKGIEIFWRDKKTIKNVDYWISYSFLDTKRDYLNFPNSMRPNFAAKHTANLVVKKFVTKWKTQFNGSYTYATGRPYYNLKYNNNDGKYVIADQGKTIDFHSMSVSVNYLPNIGKANSKNFVVWVFSLNNVLGNNQVFGYNYSANGSRKDPILPTAKRFIFLGCFLSLGVDRTQDVINSSL
ncbi:MAG TPA: TonB-dependent receptor [Flavitalea sp.]|nr:TonB-dependent receptor [Flavitalea sp.]